MKKNLFIKASAITMIALSMGFTSLSASSITATIDGKEIVFEQEPFIEDGRTLVPVRVLMEEFGLTVEYDEKTRKAVCKNDTIEIIFTLDSKIAVVNGVEKILDVPAKSINGRMMVPLRFISEEMGMGVTWDDISRKITIDSSGETKEEETKEEETAETDKAYYENFQSIKIFDSGIDESRKVVNVDNKEKLNYKVLLKEDEVSTIVEKIKKYAEDTANDEGIVNKNLYSDERRTTYNAIFEDSKILIKCYRNGSQNYLELMVVAFEEE